MNPSNMEFMRRKLSGWGYPRYLVDRLKPWSLIDFYGIERKKRISPARTDPTIDLSVAVIDNNVDPAFDSSIIETAERIDLINTPKKYRGIVVKNDDEQ